MFLSQQPQQYRIMHQYLESLYYVSKYGLPCIFSIKYLTSEQQLVTQNIVQIVETYLIFFNFPFAICFDCHVLDAEENINNGSLLAYLQK